MENNQAAGPLDFQEVLKGIGEPQQVPNTFDGILSTIPNTPPAGFETAPAPTENNPVWEWFQGMVSPSREELQAQAANAVALSDLTGVPIHEAVEQQDGALQNEKFDGMPLGEALKIRAESVSNSWNSTVDSHRAGVAYTQAVMDGDEKGKEEAIAALKAAQALGEEANDPRIPEAQRWVPRSTASVLGSVYSAMTGAVKDASVGAVAGGAVGVWAEGVGAIPGTIAGAKIGFDFGVVREFFMAQQGPKMLEYMEMGYTEDQAFLAALPSSALIAASEKFQMSLFAKNIPGLSKLLAQGFTKGILAVESSLLKGYVVGSAKTAAGGTLQEMAQQVIEITGDEIVKQVSNDLNGTNFSRTTIDAVIGEVKDVVYETAPGLLVTALVTGGMGTTAQTIGRKADERRVARYQESLKDTGVQQTPATEQEIEVTDNFGQPVMLDETVPFDEGGVVNVEGVEQPSAPITEEEIAVHETGYDVAPISREQFDNLVLLPDAQLEQGLDDTLAEATKTGDQYGDFISGIRSAVGRKQAKVVEGLIKARARATGRTKEQFAEDHRLAFRAAEGDSGTLGSVQFIKDGETIVRAFANTDLKSVTHEISHVFRRDLGAAELKAAEQAFGVKDGKWNVENEEAFAEGFVQYMATGKAPTKRLAKTFESFKNWLAETYAAVKGENVRVSPEMDEVFTQMLSGTRTANMMAGMQEAKAAAETLFSKAKKGAKQQIREATGQLPNRAGKLVDEHVAFKESLRQQVMKARKAMLEGDKKGYARAVAKAKAITQRARNRSAMTKSRARLRRQIQKLIKRSKVKKQAGKPKGKFTADFQQKVDELIEIMQMPVKEAKAEVLSKDMKEIPDDFGSDWETMKHFIMETRANMGLMDEVALTALHDDLKAFIETGKVMRHAEIAPRMARTEAAKQKLMQSLEVMREERGDTERAENYYEDNKTNWQKFVDNVRNTGIMDFHGLMERLDMGLSEVFGEGAMAVFTETLDAENQSNSGRRISNTRLLTTFAEAWGLKDKDGNPDIKLAERRLWEEERESNIDLGSYETLDKDGNKTGNTRPVSRKRAELRKLYMELQDPTIREVYLADGMTEEMMTSIRGALTQADMAMITAQFEMYNEYYDKINSVYRYMYGTDLPRNKFYSPILREYDSGTEAGPISDLLMDMKIASHAGAGSASLKSRLDSKAVTKKKSDVDVMNHYIRQMEHFMAFGPLIQEWNGVFKNKEIRKEIEAVMGKEFMNIIDSAVLNIARNGARPDDGVWSSRLIRTIRGNLARGLVGLKVLAIPKQFSSFLAFSNDVDMKDFGKYTLEWMANPVKYSKEMKELSEFLQNRGDNIERDISLIAGTKEFQGIVSANLTPSLNNLIMAFVKKGDIGAMYAGGYAYYKILRAQGLSKEAAIRKFELRARNTQQSSELGSQSAWQQGSEWMKVFTMFTTSQRQYTQAIALALEAKQNERMSNEQFTKTALIFGVALPVLFQAVSQGGMDDEDDFYNSVRAVLATPLSIVPVGGQISNYFLSYLINGHTYGRGAGGLAVYSPAESFLKGVNKLTMDDISMRDTLKALRDIAAVAEYAGIPGRQIGNVALGVQDTMEGNAVQGALEAAGMSPYSANKRANK